jgi:hypothetical protein
MDKFDLTPKHVRMHVPGPRIREIYIAPNRENRASSLNGVVDEIEQFIASHGLRLQGRFAFYMRSIRRSLLPPEHPDHIAPERPAFSRWELELRQLHDIANAFSSSDTNADYRKLLEFVLSGQALPSGREDPTARNHQFHLFLAARLRRIGYVASIREPDIEVALGADTFVVAAKRVTSQARLFRRIVEGEKQVRRSGRCGIVAIDLSEIAFPSAGRLVIGDVDGVGLSLNDELGRLLDLERNQILRTIDRSIVKAIIGHIHVVVESPQGWGNHSSFLTYYLVPPEDRWHRILRELTARSGRRDVALAVPRPDFVAGPVMGRWLSTTPGAPGVKLDELRPTPPS